MKCTMPAKLLAATCLLFSLVAPAAVRADDLIVEVSPPANSGHFSTIQAALQHAQAYITANPPGTAASKTFQIMVQPGTYTGPITAISNVNIIGSSTANTFINGTGTIISLNGVSAVAIRRFTFQTGTTAISIANSSGVEITNNVFSLNRNATAILATTASSATRPPTIANNTFYNNNIAINTGFPLEITNNIFANNNTAIAAPSGLTSLTYNAFYNNGNKGVTPSQETNLPNNAHPGLDARFVDPPNDFHLQADSPCRGSGNLQLTNSFDRTTSDIGAYGGPFSDGTATSTGPATVTGLVSTIESPLTPPTVMRLRWTASNSPSVTGYRVYYRTSPAISLKADEDQDNSGFIFVTGATATLTFSTLPTAPAAPAGTPIVTLAPGDRSLLVSWTPVAGATAYIVYYHTASFTSSSLPSTFVRVESPATSTTLAGLNNGSSNRYFVQVLPVAEIRVLAEVTAVIDNTIASAPGTKNESARSATTAQRIGESVSGTISTEKSDFPEAVSPYPDLQGKGCFIATAAYGFYSAPQVQALREFRDCYLMPHAPGRAFVAWYYRHGPRAAAYLNQHPWLKAPVRLALLPLVAMSLFLVKTSVALKITFALVGLGCWGWSLSRKGKQAAVQMGGAP
jgi:hypothetical protein